MAGRPSSMRPAGSRLTSSQYCMTIKTGSYVKTSVGQLPDTAFAFASPIDVFILAGCVGPGAARETIVDKNGRVVAKAAFQFGHVFAGLCAASYGGVASLGVFGKL